MIEFRTHSSLAHAFEECGVVYLPNIFDPETFSELRRNVVELKLKLDYKNFLMPQSNFTPRRMSVVNGHVLSTNSYISELYLDTKLITKLSDIANAEVIPCNNKIESMIISSLIYTGDTHGWHTDDYPFALIIGIEGRTPKDGGCVEFIDKNNAINSFYLYEGDAYFMRTDTIRHRVSPILKERNPRTILNFTFGECGKNVHSNGSAESLLF